MTEHLKGGNMNLYKTDTGNYVINKDYSNSAIGTSLYQSSAIPANFAGISRNATIFFLKPLITDYQFPEPDLDMEQKARETLTIEELTALYEEAAEEDKELAQIGLAHYAEVLKQEEEIE